MCFTATNLNLTVAIILKMVGVSDFYSMGAAIVVEVHRVPKVYSKLLFNPLCFLHYENASQPPEQWENVSCKYISVLMFTVH